MPLWSYATFTQNFAIAAANVSGAKWVGITWSLAVEEQFYFLFPLVVFLTPRNRLLLVTLLVLLVAPICRHFIGARYGFYASYTLLPCRMDTLMVGVICAQLLRDARVVAWLQSRLWVLYVGLFALVVLLQLGNLRLLHFDTLRYSVIAVTYGFVIVLAVLHVDGFLGRFFQHRFLVFVGLISYAIYMYHQAVNGVLHGALFGKAPALTNWTEFAVTMAAVVLTFILAYISQIAMERPIRQWGRQFKYIREKVALPNVADPVG